VSVTGVLQMMFCLHQDSEWSKASQRKAKSRCAPLMTCPLPVSTILSCIECVIAFCMFAWIGVNGCCAQEDKLTNDGVDLLFQVTKEFTERVGGPPPSLWKADIDSAYRRVPLKACDR
jgi:hypothetical protein